VVLDVDGDGRLGILPAGQFTVVPDKPEPNFAYAEMARGIRDSVVLVVK
jgi:hypothetical protein